MMDLSYEQTHLAEGLLHSQTSNCKTQSDQLARKWSVRAAGMVSSQTLAQSGRHMQVPRVGMQAKKMISPDHWCLERAVPGRGSPAVWRNDQKQQGPNYQKQKSVFDRRSMDFSQFSDHMMEVWADGKGSLIKSLPPAQ